MFTPTPEQRRALIASTRDAKEALDLLTHIFGKSDPYVLWTRERYLRAYTRATHAGIPAAELTPISARERFYKGDYTA